MSKECKKKEKGITLTGLVITIIVLIILAGISLSYFIQEGIIDKAEEAGERMNQAAGEEAEGLKNLSNEIEGLISGVVIPEGAISIGEIEWEAGRASVQVSTNTEYEIEWQKEGEESWNKVANGGKIEGLEHGDIIFIRITDGRNVGEESTVRVEDKIAPTVSISETGKTSSSITVQVEATDDETGMEENPTYTYYYKVSGQPDSSYKQVNQGTSTTCTINGLTQGMKYTVKVEVADNAGNVGKGTVDITTETVTSGTVEGAITFGPATWSNGTASITISTNTSYTIEWQIGDAEEGSWTTGTSVTGLHHGDIVFARLTDGRNVGQEATTKIEDKTAPTVSISETGKTSNSISVRAQATDNETGMASSPTYTYYYKISGQPDTSYQQASQGTSTTCTINGLTQGTKYTVKVEVADNAGNVGSGTVDITTATVTSGTVEGAIQFSPATWSNGTASITISTNTSYTIEWQIGDAEEGNWTRGTRVTGLHHGDIVFARLTDGRNVGQEATTKIEDKTAPTVSISETGKTSNSISVRAQATDNETGMASSPTYTYYYKISGQPDTSYQQASQGTSTTCTINGLTQGTKYTVKVEVADNAGNVGSGTVDITTATVTSGTVEGAIQFSPATWSNGTASITISTNTSYTIEWQIGDAEEGNWTRGTSVTGLHHGDIVFARLTDGRNVGQEATTKIEDKTAPTVSISETGKTSNSISVRAQATDNETGMASSPTYTYYYKISGQPDTSYQQASQGTSTTCTINGLTQGTKYTVKVEVADNAGNVGSGTVDITTATVTSGTVEGAIQFSPATWSNGTASITISTNTSYTIEWQIGDAEEGNWTRGTRVTGLHHGDIVFARLTDGKNVGQEATTKIEDKTAPKVTVTVGEVTTNSIAVTVEVTENESGLVETYQYYLGNVLDGTSTSNSYKYEGLEQETEYNLVVKVQDKAGNEGEGTTTATTKGIPTIESTLREGKYVWYTDAYGTQQKCIVLYGPENENYSSYGIQIITADTVTDNYILGSSDFNTSRNIYNSAITTLNEEAEKYRKKDDGIAEVARCVGSVPDNPNYDGAGMHTTQFGGSYSGTLKDTDTNYEADYIQMQSIVINGQGIHNIGKNYWLASRYVYATSSRSYFSVRHVAASGSLINYYLCDVDSVGRTYGYSLSYGLRLVLHLKSGIKVTGGDGSEGNPYTLAP